VDKYIIENTNSKYGSYLQYMYKNEVFQIDDEYYQLRGNKILIDNNNIYIVGTKYNRDETLSYSEKRFAYYYITTLIKYNENIIIAGSKDQIATYWINDEELYLFENSERSIIYSIINKNNDLFILANDNNSLYLFKNLNIEKIFNDVFYHSMGGNPKMYFHNNDLYVVGYNSINRREHIVHIYKNMEKIIPDKRVNFNNFVLHGLKYENNTIYSLVYTERGFLYSRNNIFRPIVQDQNRRLTIKGFDAVNRSIYFWGHMVIIRLYG